MPWNFTMGVMLWPPVLGSAHQVSFSFDRFSKHYQGIVREVANEPGVDCAVVAHVYVDDRGSYARSEFRALYTGL